MIYLSPVPWASFSQRSHHFVNWFNCQSGEPVLWIDPYPTRLPSLSDFRRKPSVANQQNATTPPWLQVCKLPALPIEPIPGMSLLLKQLWRDIFKKSAAFSGEQPCMICVGKPSEFALQLLARMPDSYTVYDAMDDFPAFYTGLSRRSMEQRQHRLANQVSKVLASSTAIRDKLLRVTDQVELALNACDVQKFAPVESLDLGTKEQIFGYVGTVGRWFDWELVVALARANPENKIQLFGPIFTPAPCALPSNIELLPERSHALAVAAMATFSVGLIPFKLSRLTESVDPIKYYEYRALGLPVISTRFGEMAQRSAEPGIWLVDEQTDLHQTSREALAYRDKHMDVIQFRQDNLWAARFSATELPTQQLEGPTEFNLRTRRKTM